MESYSMYGLPTQHSNRDRQVSFITSGTLVPRSVPADAQGGPRYWSGNSDSPLGPHWNPLLVGVGVTLTTPHLGAELTSQ